jgi:hypothetical protein
MRNFKHFEKHIRCVKEGSIRVSWAWYLSDLYQGFRHRHKCSLVSDGSDEKLDVILFCIKKDVRRPVSSSTK